jgi:hypothetical protein
MPKILADALLYGSGTDLVVNGTATISQTLAVDTNVLYVDAVNDQVGVNINNIDQITFSNPPDLCVANVVGGILDLRRFDTTVLGNDLIGRLQWSVKDDATDGYCNAWIDAYTWTTAGTGNSGGSYMTLSTSASGIGTSPAPRVIIGHTGDVTIGLNGSTSTTEANSKAKLHVNGNSFIDGALLRSLTEVAKSASNIFSINLSNNDSFLLNASGTYYIELSISSSNIGQSGTIIINNTAATTAQALPSYMLTPEGATLDWVNTSGAVSIISYFVLATDKVLCNYVGNFQ